MTIKTVLGAAALTFSLTAGASSAATLSPTTSGELPSAVSPIGGIVLDLIGLNGARVVSQAPASSLFSGYASQNPEVIGTLSGFDTSITNALGGGIAEASVRITLDDGDSGSGDFDEDANFLFLNGYDFGNFSDVSTVETDSAGNILTSGQFGFGDNSLDTGFFYQNDTTLLSNLYGSLLTSEEIVFALNDTDGFSDNFLDFTQGVDNSLINVGQAPTIAPSPVPLPAGAVLLLTGVAAVGALKRRKAQA